MAVTFSGDRFESTSRVITNCYSLDWALGDHLGNVGFPTKSLVEVYGNKGVGKSTFCFSLMGIMASKLQKNVCILDWEGQSKETIEGVLSSQNFFGNVDYILNQADESSEETVERFLLAIDDEGQNIGLIDSLGGFLPTAYLEGQISDSSMGVMARETGRMVNKAKRRVLLNSGVIFMTNHKHPKIGGFVQGEDTAGGVKKKFLSHVRMDLNRAFLGKSTVSFDNSWLLKGRIDDNRYGHSKREFYVFMMGGEGIHVGLTAMWDCIVLGLAKTSAQKIAPSCTVSMEGKSYGKLGSIIERRNEDPEMFVPFMNALRENAIDEVQDGDEE